MLLHVYSDNCLAGIRTFTLSMNDTRGLRLIMEGERKDAISLANPLLNRPPPCWPTDHGTKTFTAVA